MVKVYALIASLFVSQILLGQCLVEKISLPDRVSLSDCIVEGEVVDQFCFEEAGSGHILTANTIEVFRVFKGDRSLNQVTLFTLGGVLGDRMETATPSLQFQKGQVGIFMLYDFKELDVMNSIHMDKTSGFWGVKGPASYIGYDIATGRAIDIYESFASLNIVREDLEYLTKGKAMVKKVYETPILGSNKKAGISSFSPTTVTGGTLTTLTIKGTGFGSTQATVYFSNPDDGGKTLLAYSDSAYFEKVD